MIKFLIFIFLHFRAQLDLLTHLAKFQSIQKSFYFNIYLREFTAAINQPCSKAWLQMGESDVKDSNIPHGLKL